LVQLVIGTTSNICYE